VLLLDEPMAGMNLEEKQEKAFINIKHQHFNFFI
jgi:ABC-type branched-subunit amino acid transport system ATPase component